MGGARRGTNSNALLENACLAQGIYPWITSNESLPELQMKWDCRDEVSGPSAPLLTIKSLALSQAGDVRELTFPTWLESRGSSSHRRTGAGTAMESTGQHQDTGCSHRSGSAEGNPCPRSTYLGVSTTSPPPEHRVLRSHISSNLLFSPMQTHSLLAKLNPGVSL